MGFLERGLCEMWSCLTNDVGYYNNVFILMSVNEEYDYIYTIRDIHCRHCFVAIVHVRQAHALHPKSQKRRHGHITLLRTLPWSIPPPTRLVDLTTK
jgi:hypothetical protein